MFTFPTTTYSFNPRQISGLVLWLDASDPAATGTQPANNTSISTWVDKSSRGNSATQATGANQPVFVTSGLNSKPSFSTNASTQMDILVSGFPTGSTGRTGFVVITQSSGTGDPGIQYGNTSAASWSIGGVNLGGGATIYSGVFGAFETGAIILTTGTAYVLELNYPGGGTLSTQGGTVNGVADTMTTNSGNPTLNTNTSAPKIIFGAVGSYVGEMIFYNTSLTAAQQTAVRKYLRNKWGI